MNRFTVGTLGTIVLAGLAGLAIAAAPTAPPPAAPPAGGITILSDTTLPASMIWARDVRWASDGSVYLSLVIDGTVEFSLGQASSPKELIPGAAKPGGFWASYKLAASSRYLVVGGPSKSLTWRRLDDPTRQEEVFDNIGALDVQDNRLAILGARRDEQQRFAPEGAIAWVGSLDRKLADLKPLLYDIRGVGAPTLNRCLGAPLGAVRFLPDGTVVVVPGVQPGVNLYDASGKLLRTWETSALGIDTDCGSLTEQQSLHLTAHFAEFHAWLNQRRTLDALVSLPKGDPGFIVRKVEQGKTHWDFKVLRRDGTIESHPVPIEGNGELFHLAADVRSDRMVFLLYETLPRGLGRSFPVPPHLLVAQAPKTEPL